MVTSTGGSFGLYCSGMALLCISVLLNRPHESGEEVLEPSSNTLSNAQLEQPLEQGPTSPSAKAEVFSIVEEMPSFPGGEAEMFRFIRENIRYPVPSGKAENAYGTVYVTFIVDETGNLTNPTLPRGLGDGHDAEALRVVQAMPTWNPGKQRGLPVRVQYNLPVRFNPNNAPTRPRATERMR